MKAETVT